MKSLILKDYEVRGILDGSVTQIVRVVKPQPMKSEAWTELLVIGNGWAKFGSGDVVNGKARIPFGQPGELLAGKEAYKRNGDGLPTGITYRAGPAPNGLLVWLDGTEPEGMREAIEKMPYSKGWRPAQTMPQWASRLTLKNKAVRVERVQDCSEADAVARGCPIKTPDPFIKGHGASSASGWFSEFWESVNGPGTWNRSEWVWVLDIERVKP